MDNVFRSEFLFVMFFWGEGGTDVTATEKQNFQQPNLTFKVNTNVPDTVHQTTTEKTQYR